MNWLLSITYFLHLAATVVWIGGLAMIVIFALPAWTKGVINDNQWLSLQKRFLPYANGSMVVLLLSGFYQMTTDPNYAGFLVLDGVWAWSMLLKHVAFVGMLGILAYSQFVLFPEFDRIKDIFLSKPAILESELAPLKQRERRLLWVNMVCAGVILLFTAIATAV